VARPSVEGRTSSTSARSSLPWLSPASAKGSVEGAATEGTPGLGPHARQHHSHGPRYRCVRGVDLRAHSDAYLGVGRDEAGARFAGMPDGIADDVRDMLVSERVDPFASVGLDSD
jgi:hypothetical protein